MSVPAAATSRQSAGIIFLIVGLWALMVFGFQILLFLVQRDPVGSSFLTDARFLGFPFHYWFTGQFSIIGFLLLCIWFNRLFDRVVDSGEDARRGQE